MLTRPISQGLPASSRRALDPVDRVAEVLCGLMVLVGITMALGG